MGRVEFPALAARGNGKNDVAVTYWMNRLQGIDNAHPVFVTLNPPLAPRADLTFGRYWFDHPQFSTAAFAAQKRLGDIQGRRHIWFCGAWTGHGFHEDGLLSGLAVAEALGVVAPWRETPPELARGRGIAMAGQAAQTATPNEAAALYFGDVDACAAEADGPPLQLSRHERLDRPRPTR